MRHLFFIVCFFLVACSDSRTLKEVQVGDHGIYNGKTAKPGDAIFKSAVYLETKQDEKADAKACSGTALSREIVLTAAHCVTDQNYPGFVAPFHYVGVRESGTGQLITASEVRVAPGYLATFKEQVSSNMPHSWGHDLALVKLQKPLPAWIVTAEIPQNFDEIFLNPIFAAGFGRHSNDPSKRDGLLRVGRIEIVKDLNYLFQSLKIEKNGKVFTPDLKAIPANRPYARNFTFIKGSLDSGICQGDSGGPLFYEKNGRIFIIGVLASMISKDNAALGFCTDSANIEQIATSVLGTNLRWISENFLAMTNRNLIPFSLPARNQDKNDFSYYLTYDGPRINKLINLESATAAIYSAEKQDYIGIISSSSPCRENFSKHPLFAPSQRIESLHEATLPLMQMVHEEAGIGNFFEAKIVRKNQHLRVVVLTPEGFVANTLPIKKCN